MPKSGDLKWIRNDRLTTKKEISDEIGIATTGVNWAISAMQAIAETAMFTTSFSVFILAVSISAGTFYKNHKEALQKLFKEIEGLGANQKFYVEQKHRWHAGHRAWQPLSSFRVKKV